MTLSERLNMAECAFRVCAEMDHDMALTNTDVALHGSLLRDLRDELASAIARAVAAEKERDALRKALRDLIEAGDKAASGRRDLPGMLTHGEADKAARAALAPPSPTGTPSPTDHQASEDR